MDFSPDVSWPVFIGVTVLLFGGCAFMTGQSLANRWRSPRMVVPYCLLLTAGDRFLIFALWQGDPWSIKGFLLHAATLSALCLLAYQATRARRMTTQYPWLYERVGAFGWRPLGEPDDPLR